MSNESDGSTKTGTATDAWRQQVIDARREQILDAAADVFAEKGFDRATIRDIAGRAGIADGTIYNYFENKQGLFMALFNKVAFAGLDDIFSSATPFDPEDILRALLRNRFEFVNKHRRILVSVFPSLMANAELRAMLFRTQIPIFVGRAEGFMRQGIAAGRIADIEPRVVIQMVVGALISYVLLSSTPEIDFLSDMTEDELLDQWAKILIYGLVTRPEVE